MTQSQSLLTVLGSLPEKNVFILLQIVRSFQCALLETSNTSVSVTKNGHISRKKVKNAVFACK